MTVRECAALQCLGCLNQLPARKGRAFRALGNAVNARLVALVAQRLFSSQWTGSDIKISVRVKKGAMGVYA